MNDLPKNFNAYTTQDAVTHVDANGKLAVTYEEGMHVDLENISAIGIANLCDVTNYIVNHIVGSTSHVVRFKDGSSVQFAYSDSGEHLEFSGNNIAIRVEETTRIMVVAKSPL